MLKLIVPGNAKDVVPVLRQEDVELSWEGRCAATVGRGVLPLLAAARG